MRCQPHILTVRPYITAASGVRRSLLPGEGAVLPALGEHTLPEGGDTIGAFTLTLGEGGHPIGSFSRTLGAGGRTLGGFSATLGAGGHPIGSFSATLGDGAHTISGFSRPIRAGGTTLRGLHIAPRLTHRTASPHRPVSWSPRLSVFPLP
ncbi:MAG: hypothetical protein U1F81_22575 [Verrucomicrobiaceae bacterium]